MASASQERTGRRLLQVGVVLFLLGLLAGFAIPSLANPRMGLASHLEGVMNGTFVIAVGLMWSKLVLSERLLRAAFWLIVYGTLANWTATFLAAAWGAGAMMPIAAQGHGGTAGQEGVIRVMLISLALAMVSVCVLLLVGLRSPGAENPR